MTREELIKQCRYYKGEKECPIGVKASFWCYEENWVDFSINQKSFIDEMIRDYYASGLNAFASSDNVPLSLKALLYNRYSHWNSPYVNTDEFKKWYMTEYIN